MFLYLALLFQLNNEQRMLCSVNYNSHHIIWAQSPVSEVSKVVLTLSTLGNLHRKRSMHFCVWHRAVLNTVLFSHKHCELKFNGNSKHFDVRCWTTSMVCINTFSSLGLHTMTMSSSGSAKPMHTTPLSILLLSINRMFCTTWKLERKKKNWKVDFHMGRFGVKSGYNSSLL